MVAVAVGRARRVRPADAAATAGAALYTAALAITATAPSVSPFFFPLLALPLGFAVYLLLSRRPLSYAVRDAMAWCILTFAAVFTTLLMVAVPVLALAAPALLLTFAVARRHPAAVVIAVFVLTGTYGTWTAYGNLPSGESVDVLLGAAWLAAIAGWLLHGPRRAVWLWPGIALGAAYIAVSLVFMLGADNLDIGIRWFRASIWYFAAVILVAYAPWPPGTRMRIAQGMLVVGGLVGAYATLRWIIGPSGDERELAERLPNNFLDGELRPIGSLTSAKELAAWCAIVSPFALGCALAFRGTWRWVAAAACALLVVAMLAADVRAAAAAVVPAAVVVLALFAASQAFPGGQKTGVVSVAVIAALVGGVAAFAVTLGGKEQSATRYANILTPERDPSVQARTFKWRTAIDDIEERPLGNGGGSAGRTQAQRGRFLSVGSIDIDNSYLKIAYEQGFAVMALFGAAFLLLVGGLARRAIVTADRSRATLALAACGTGVSMLVLFLAGDYVEGLPALAGWLLVGVGVGQFTFAPTDEPE